MQQVFKYTLLCALVFCANTLLSKDSAKIAIPAAHATELYFKLLQNKNVAVVANQTSTIGAKHLVDSLLAFKIKVKKVFAPEHGFRGNAANGEKVINGIDAKTGIPIISLYGAKSKPQPADLQDIEMVIFDIQDVGVRFYTYLTTLHYVMQACAENNKTLLLLDRPNPNSHYIDGPILEKGMESMVGMHPIPLVHGMTLGELAGMIQKEGWLKTKDTCKLIVIPVQNWTHSDHYQLPIPPSPNLPTAASIILYPSLGLLEGTEMSMGRGTPKPFEWFGAPWFTEGNTSFTPENIPGKAQNPPFLNQKCKGILLTDFASNYLISYPHIYLEWLVMLYKAAPDSSKFFNPFLHKLAGTTKLMTQIKAGMSADAIRKTWEPGLVLFSAMRKKYLLYP